MRVAVRSAVVSALVFGLVLAGLSLSVEAGGPKDAVRDATERALGILNDEGKSPVEKRVLFRALMWEKINFTETSRMTLGPKWPHDPLKQMEFTALFAELIERSYVNSMDKADVAFTYLKEYAPDKSDRSRYVVQTIMRTPKRDIPIDYAVMQVGGKWQIYNIMVGGVSLVSNWSAQFQRIINNSSFDNLILVLRDKIAKFDQGRP